MKIVGLERSQGVYKEVDYDNFLVYCESGKGDILKPGLIGKMTAVYKIKAPIFLESMSLKSELDAIDKNILPLFNQYGKIYGVLPMQGT